MGSSAKKKTTMAKMNRERNVRERRFEKQARKDARKRGALDEVAPSDDASNVQEHFGSDVLRGAA
jgi:hypothetical protein